MSTGHMPFMLVHRAGAKLPIDLALGTSGNIPLYKFAHKVTELVKQAHEMMFKAYMHIRSIVTSITMQ